MNKKFRFKPLYIIYNFKIVYDGLNMNFVKLNLHSIFGVCTEGFETEIVVAQHNSKLSNRLDGSLDGSS